MKSVEEIKQETERKRLANAEKKRLQWQDVAEYPLYYTALFVSGVLSMLAGLCIGLGVHKVGDVINYSMDVPHLFFAFLYGVLFPVFFEVALWYWLNKYLHREADNKNQEWSSGIMVVVTFLGTAITAFSAVTILTSLLGALSEFQTISPDVQWWITACLPTMLMANILSGEVYKQSSKMAELMRSAEMEFKQQKLDADLRVRLARLSASAGIQIGAAKSYAEQAQGEIASIGKQKGQASWQSDRLMHGYASEAEIEVLNTDGPPN